MTDKAVVLVTAGSLEEAEKIATALVEGRLAACATIVPSVRSIYRWEGKVQNEQEVLLIIKTSHSRFTALRDEVARLHSYAVPEIICLPIADGAESYLNWIGQESNS